MATFGAALRRAREQRRISLDAIAAETRLSKRYILALEDEALSKLPGGTYNRAYLRTYASVLGLDPESLVRDYAQEESRQMQLAEADELAAMTRALEARAAAASGSGTIRAREVLATPAGIGAVAVLAFSIVGGVVWFGLSGFQRASSDMEVASTEAAHPATFQPTTSKPASRTPAAPASPASQPVLAPAAPVAVAPDAAQPSKASAQSSRPVVAAPVPEIAPTRTTSVPPQPSLPSPVPGAPVAPASLVSSGAAGGDIVRMSDARSASRLTVAGSGVGTAVVERRLVGQADHFSVGSKVVFWTHVRGGKVGDIIDHVWFRDGTLVGAASLVVGSPNWRTQSRRLLDPSGAWVVEARDAEGHVLARHEFHAGS